MSASAAEASSSSSVGRPSLDSSTIAPSTNGQSSHPTTNDDDNEETWQPISSMSDEAVRAELARVRDERDTFESQYRSLLSKLTTMRATLGDRLRQDAEELDRRETQIDTLTSRVSELEGEMGTLKEELIASHGETDRLSREVDTLRKSLNAKESELAKLGDLGQKGRLERERELHELVERVKIDAHSWQSSCLEERSKREDLETRLVEAQHEVERAQQAEAHHRAIAERESASAANLSSVLSEFQSSQETELQRALGDHHAQISSLTSDLNTYKTRAETAESQLQQSADLTAQAEKLSSQVHEKNLLIGKLRHEAVILNEHLTEALRRLRNQQSEGTVDKRLVTNLVISFVTTPRSDGKRYEMLQLIAGVLGWTAEEREAAGLQKGGGGRPGMNRVVSGGGKSAGSGGNGVGGDESFSNLFVEFLLSEAERGKDGKAKDAEEGSTSEGTTTPVLPTRLFSPTRGSFGTDPTSPRSEGGRSSTSAAAEDGANSKPSGGGIGSYFGLSRAAKK